MTGYNQPPLKFIEEMTNYLEANDFSSAINVFCDIKYKSFLKNNSWDLIPVFCKHITKETKSNNEELAVCCEKLLEKLASEANPEEAVLEFLDQMDESDTEKFTVILNLLKIILSRETSNGFKSLEWTLNSIRSYTEKFSFNDNLENLSDSDDEKFFSPDKLSEIKTVMGSVILFFEYFVEELSQKPDAENVKSLLASRLIQTFDLFLPYINLELHPEIKAISKKTIDLLLKLLPNPMTLLEYVFFRALNVMKSKVVDSVKTSRKVSVSEVTDESWTKNDFTESKYPYEDETVISNLAYGMFFYLLLSETENELIKVPMIYNPKYVMLSLIYVTVPFFDRNDIAVHNGLKFLTFLLNLLNDSLTKSDLYFSTHKNLLMNLNQVMIYSQVEENRKLALSCFKKYIESFDWEGRYLLLFNFRSCIKHSGTLGFLISLLKDFVSTFLELPQNSQIYYKFLKYYKGKLLFDIIKKYCYLSNGSNTDLVENADHIISSLNALRYLVLRDKKNVTDVKHFIKKIHEDFLKLLKENIASSKDFYYLKLKDLESKNQTNVATSCSETDVNVELAVKGETLPKLTKEQQILAYNSCLNAVDLIDSLLIRLIECINDAYSLSL